MRWILFVTLLMLVLVNDMQAQDNALTTPCGELWFFMGQPLKVIGSVDLGGLPFRDKPELAESVEGVFPLDSIIWTSTRSESVCADNRTWIEIEHASSNRDLERAWVVVGDGYSEWVTPSTNCNDYSQDMYVDGSIQAITIDSSGQSVQINVSKDNSSRVTDRYSVSLDTWHVTHTSSPSNLTPDERAALNASPENGTTAFTSPDGNYRLIYVPDPSPMPHGCGEVCGLYNIYLFRKGEDQPTKLGNTFNILSPIEATWHENKVYVTYVNEVYGGVFTDVFCLDGSCADHELKDELQMLSPDLALMTENGFEFTFSFPTFSPNGKFMAVSRISDYDQSAPNGDLIFNLDTGDYWTLPPNGDAYFPVMWGKEYDDRNVIDIYYPVDINWMSEEDIAYYERITYFAIQDDLFILQLDENTGDWQSAGHFNASYSIDSTKEMFLGGFVPYAMTPNKELFISTGYLRVFCRFAG